MLFLFLAFLSVAVAVAEVRRSRREGPASPVGSLLLGGAAFLAGWLIQNALRLLAGDGGGPLPVDALRRVQVVALALTTVPLWVALVRLLLYRWRASDLFLLVPFALLSILLRAFAPGLPAGLAELAVLPLLVRLRWRREVSAGSRGLVSLFGFLFVLLNLIPSRLPMPDGSIGAGLGQVLAWHDWVRLISALYMMVALPGLLWGLELPIRSIKRRLLVSHLLAGLVPLVLIALFWGLSTYLSVSGERARIASRYLEESARELSATVRGAMMVSLQDGPPPGLPGIPARPLAFGRAPWSGPQAVVRPDRSALVGWSRLQSTVWPGLRVWCRNPQGGSLLERVYGDSVPGEQLIATWPADRPRAGVVLLAGRAYIGAVCFPPDDSGPGPLSAALVPVGDLLGPSFQEKFDATAHIETGFMLRLEGGFTVASRDSASAALSLDDEFARAHQTSPGAALLQAIEWSRGQWHDRQVLLWVRVGFLSAVRGLAQNLRENPFNLFPLIFLAVVAGLFVLVQLLTVGMVVAMGRSILRAISALRQGTARLRSGNFRYRIPIEASDELWEVGDSFNEMAADLDKARDLEIEKERMEGELELARQIQGRLLPAQLPVFPRWELSGLSVPARHVGGDYYDVLRLDPDRIGLIAADVSGKGVPAALLMSSFRASLLSLDLAGQGPGRTFDRLNAFLHHSIEPGRFVTAFLGVLTLSSGRMVFANAGHNPPYLVRAGGEVLPLREAGLILGLFGDTRYQQGEAILHPGDLLALYTDGVTEATDEAEEFYGEERLLELLGRMRGDPTQEIVNELLEEIRTFSGSAGQSDDITMLLARRM